MTGPILDVSYLSLRKSIGWIGILMPWVARAVAHFRDGTPMLLSISAYYHTSGRDIFVGSLFAAGLFLAFYRGALGSLQDRIIAPIWGLSAAGIGLIPMNPCNDFVLLDKLQLHDFCQESHTTLHFIPVTLFFAINFYMTIFRFTKPSRLPVTREKLQRNTIYKVSGWIMTVSVLAIGAIKVFKLDVSIFAFEAIAIGTFGIAWLVKGQMILADRDQARAV